MKCCEYGPRGPIPNTSVRGVNFINLLIVAIYHPSMVLLSFCVVKQHYCSNYNINGSILQWCFYNFYNGGKLNYYSNLLWYCGNFWWYLTLENGRLKVNFCRFFIALAPVCVFTELSKLSSFECTFS